VADALAADGWAVLARNWRGGGAELDLVVLRNGCLRFVEVKARFESDDAVDAVTDDKQRRLSAGAEAFLADFQGDFAEAAFLVAIVLLDSEPWSIAWIDDAFDGR
jgi:putative endonuclease